ncbi:MAG: CotH kinase family protein [Leadbetterella sp.]
MKKSRIIMFSSLVAFVLACKEKTGVDVDPAKSNDTKPDYATVFPQDKVNTLEITIGKTGWDAIKLDMKSVLSTAFGSNPGGQQGGGQVPQGGGQFPQGGGGGPTNLTKKDPAYVDVVLKFNGKTWNHVGFRLKGNSSLSASWGAGTYKLPFRIKMDEYEVNYPETKNQRLYGFKDLSFSPAYSDASMIREKLTSDIFSLYGVKTARTSFCRLVIDFGEGPKYCGVYTIVEVIDDTMVKDQFGTKSGNIYKPESNFVSYSQTAFAKKNNDLTPDYTDVQNFVKALNASNRTSDAAAWRSELEKHFNISDYLKFLAVSNSIVNWDTYGAIPHNYYFYNDPTKKLTWIPWDHNMSMSSGFRSAVSLPLTEGTSSWPLLKFVKEDPVYFGQYKANVKDFNAKVFTSGKAIELLNKYKALVEPHVNGAEKEAVPYSQLRRPEEFTTGIEALRKHINDRIPIVNSFAP